MIKPEKPLKKKDQVLIDEEIAQRLQEELQAELEEEERLARQKEEEDNLISEDNTQAMMEADYEADVVKEYSSMIIEMLQNIDREDLETLWKLVKAKHRNTRSEDAYERVLWGDLKVMFEPDVESENLHILYWVEKKYHTTPAKITKMLTRSIKLTIELDVLSTTHQLLKLMTNKRNNPGSVLMQPSLMKYEELLIKKLRRSER
ncbi:hypothetical protein Tco_0210474 [Tanacetum coccineum]